MADFTRQMRISPDKRTATGFAGHPKSDLECGAGSKVAILDNIKVIMSFRSLRSRVQIPSHDRNRKFTRHTETTTHGEDLKRVAT